MTGPLREVDDEFADFVRARQLPLLRAAHLVCGDEKRAERLVTDAFTALWSSWRTVQDEDLDAFVRRTLYRSLTSGRRRRPLPVSEGPPDRPPSAVAAALAALSPRQRAVVVLRHVERRSERDIADALGISRGAVAAHDTAAQRRLHELLPQLGDPGPGARAADLERLLALAAEHVVERDLVRSARDGARALRNRRRRVGAISLAVGTALAVGLVVVPSGQESSDRPTGARTPPARDLSVGEWDAGEVDVLGVPVQVGPTARQLAELPRVDDATRGQLALPDVLAFGPDTRIPDLSAVGGSGAPVRAVLLRHTVDGLRAVLVRPTLADPYVLVDSLPLIQTLDERGASAEPLEVRAIADDRRHVMFVQPGRVHVLDAFTTTVRSFAVPDRHLAEGGWAGGEVIVWSQTHRWRVSPDTGQVNLLGDTAYPGRYLVTVAGADGLRIRGFDARGRGSASRTGPGLLSGTWGDTFTNDEDRLATGGFLSRPAASELNRQRPLGLSQGVLALDGRTPTEARLLVAPGSEGAAVECCEVLGWAFKDEVLVRWRITDLLMWNARTGALLRVSTLPGPAQDPPVIGTAAASVALAP